MLPAAERSAGVVLRGPLLVGSAACQLREPLSRAWGTGPSEPGPLRPSGSAFGPAAQHDGGSRGAASPPKSVVRLSYSVVLITGGPSRGAAKRPTKRGPTAPTRVAVPSRQDRTPGRIALSGSVHLYAVPQDGASPSMLRAAVGVVRRPPEGRPIRDPGYGLRGTPLPRC